MAHSIDMIDQIGNISSPKLNRVNGTIHRTKAYGFIWLIDELIIIVAMIVFVAAIIGISNIITDSFGDVYMDLTFSIPKFDYIFTSDGETGNEIFRVYQQIRLIAGVVLAFTALIGILGIIMENREIDTIKQGTSKKLLAKVVMFGILFMVFPPIWDGMATLVEDASLWILNPIYTFDADNPCPASWSHDKIRKEYNESEFKKDGDIILYSDIKKAEIVCKPEFKVHYLIKQFGTNTEFDADFVNNPIDLFRTIYDMLVNFVTGIFINMFIALGKIILTFNVFFISLIIGVILDMLTALVIAGLPLFVILSMIPRFKKISDKFLEMIPALILIPIVSALIVVTGSGFVSSIPEQEFIQDAADSGLNIGLLYTWLSSVAVIFFVATIPIFMIPMISQISKTITTSVSHATSSSAFVGAMGAQKMAKGMSKMLSKNNNNND
jgi:hypothetical protein